MNFNIRSNNKKNEYILDIEQNKYPVVQLGNQLWIIKNWICTKYSNGSDIPEITDINEFGPLCSEAYIKLSKIKPNYADMSDVIYYNKYVDMEKLPPKGWRVPLLEDYKTLLSYLIDNGYNSDGSTDYNKVSTSLSSIFFWKASTTKESPGDFGHINNKTNMSIIPYGFIDGNELKGLNTYAIIYDKSLERPLIISHNSKCTRFGDMRGSNIGASIRLVKNI